MTKICTSIYFSLVPVFDARKTRVDSSINFEDLPKSLPAFEGEVPVGSCVAVGHSISSYPGKKTGEDDISFATNVLFVIVFGVPD